MESDSLAEMLLEEFKSIPPQLQAAARFVLDHPADVALMSMRKQGRRMGVSDTTMARLAIWLELDSYDDLRANCARELREAGRQWHGSADSKGWAEGEENSAVARTADTLIAQIAGLGEADSKISPLARFARETVVLPTHSLSIFQSMALALAVTEILAALTAEKSGANIAEMRRRPKQQFAAFDRPIQLDFAGGEGHGTV